MTTAFAEDGGWDDENAADRGANPDFGGPDPLATTEPAVGGTGIDDAGTDYLDGDSGEPASSLTADSDYGADSSTDDLSALDVNALDTPYDETESDRVFADSEGGETVGGDDVLGGSLGSADDYDSTGSDGGTDSMEGLSEPTDGVAGYGSNDSLGDVGASDTGDYATAGEVGTEDTYEPVGDPNFEEDTSDSPQSLNESSEAAEGDSGSDNEGGLMDKAKDKLNDLMGNSHGSNTS